MGGRVEDYAWVSRVVAQMRDFAAEPAHWWVHGNGPLPNLQGRSADDFTHLQDNLVFMVAVDFFPGPNPMAVWRLNMGSDKYQATEIPLAVLNAAKRAVFGTDVPEMSIRGDRADGRKWWTMCHKMSPEEGILRLENNFRTTAVC